MAVRVPVGVADAVGASVDVTVMGGEVLVTVPGTILTPYPRGKLATGSGAQRNSPRNKIKKMAQPKNGITPSERFRLGCCNRLGVSNKSWVGNTVHSIAMKRSSLAMRLRVTTAAGLILQIDSAVNALFRHQCSCCSQRAWHRETIAMT